MQVRRRQNLSEKDSMEVGKKKFALYEWSVPDTTNTSSTGVQCTREYSYRRFSSKKSTFVSYSSTGVLQYSVLVAPTSTVYWSRSTIWSTRVLLLATCSTRYTTGVHCTLVQYFMSNWWYIVLYCSSRTINRRD